MSLDTEKPAVMAIASGADYLRKEYGVDVTPAYIRKKLVSGALKCEKDPINNRKLLFSTEDLEKNLLKLGLIDKKTFYAKGKTAPIEHLVKYEDKIKSKRTQKKIQEVKEELSKLHQEPEPTEDDLAQVDLLKRLLSGDTDISLAEANVYKTIYQGKMQELEYRKKSGEVIARVDVENAAFTAARTIRDRLMIIPERLSDELATMSNKNDIKEFLYQEFEVTLQSLSGDLQRIAELETYDKK